MRYPWPLRFPPIPPPISPVSPRLWRHTRIQSVEEQMKIDVAGKASVTEAKLAVTR